ncbi:MAG: hypothetical protein R2690_03550 [Acidimicrobiales bacterium]
MNIAILAAEGGHAANNWFFGDIKEVIVTGLASIILFGLLWWKGGPALKDMWNGRINRIADEVTDAEAARADAERALGEAQGRVADLDTEKARLLSEACHRRGGQGADHRPCREGGRRAVERARTDALAAREQAATDLQAEIAGLALGAAEAIVHDSLDDATQAALVDSYIAGVSA